MLFPLGPLRQIPLRSRMPDARAPACVRVHRRMIRARRNPLLQTTTFAELGLSAKVQAAIAAAGYTEPTPIQAQAIPVAVTGRDVLGIAQTGTGKTAAFVLPMLDAAGERPRRARMPRTLILEPTRELAAQVAESFEKYGKNHRAHHGAADRRRLVRRPEQEARPRRRRPDRHARPPARPVRARHASC